MGIKLQKNIYSVAVKYNLLPGCWKPDIRLSLDVRKPKNLIHIQSKTILNKCVSQFVPVSMDVGGTEGKAVVQQGWVNHGSILCPLQ